MKIKNLTIVILLLLISESCTTIEKVYKHNYVMNDSPQRNLVLNMRLDSTFLLRNLVEGDLRFSLIGKWRRIDDRTFILNEGSVKFDHKLVAPAQGGKVDSRKAFEEKEYLFPFIANDTLLLDQRCKSFMLNGFKFEIGHQARD